MNTFFSFLNDMYHLTCYTLSFTSTKLFDGTVDELVVLVMRAMLNG